MDEVIRAHPVFSIWESLKAFAPRRLIEQEKYSCDVHGGTA